MNTPPVPGVPHRVAPGGSFWSAAGTVPQPGLGLVIETLEQSVLVRSANAGNETTRHRAARGSQRFMRMRRAYLRLQAHELLLATAKRLYRFATQASRLDRPGDDQGGAGVQRERARK